MKFHSRPWIDLPLRAVRVLRTDGVRVFVNRAAELLRDCIGPSSYKSWINRYDSLTERERMDLCAQIDRWHVRPLISVLMPIANVQPDHFKAAIRSLQRQLYSNWECCVSCDASTVEHIKTELHDLSRHESRLRLACDQDAGSIAGNAKWAFAHASGEYIAFMAADDELSEQAIYRVAEEIVENPDVDLLFSDEDTISSNGVRSDPWFKSDWNPALMLSRNGFGNLGVYRRALVEKVGGLRRDFDGRHSHELVLRCAQATPAERIRHIPRVLYHRRAIAVAADDSEISIAWDAGRQAIEEHLNACGLRATVGRVGARSYQVDYGLPSPAPHISILLPSSCNAQLLEPCLRSLMNLSTYENFEVLLLVNERHRHRLQESAALTCFATSPRLRLLTYPDRPFNYSWVNNWGAKQAAGDLLCFLNDDTTIITPNWLERLAARALLPGVGAAGPMLYYPNEIIQHAGVILGLGGLAGHACHGLPRGSRGYFDRGLLEQDVSCMTAACLMMRRTEFQDLGGFDEALPIAFNDLDLCLRLRAAGWRIIWTPSVELYHHESVSVGRHDSDARADEFAKAVALMRKRWDPILNSDPFYNLNLSLRREGQLARPPRRPVDLVAAGRFES